MRPAAERPDGHRFARVLELMLTMELTYTELMEAGAAIPCIAGWFEIAPTR